MTEALLAVQDLSVTFHTKQGPLKAIDGISYTIDKGKTLGIVGESGCGKTVCSFAVMGLIEPPGTISGGRIFFNGEDLLSFPENKMETVRGKRIAMIFQEPMTAFNPVYTIGFQLDEQILRHENVSRTESKNRAIEILSEVGIPSPEKRYHSFPHQLSGGMRQRAMIAMALSCNPELIIADEPTTAIDVTIQAQIMELMQSLQSKYNTAIQFITHDLGVISEMADEVVVMYCGKICEVADAETIFSNPRHPYTYGLMASIPKRGRKVDTLFSIPGNVIGLSEIPEGCRFQNRCLKVTKRCRAASPELTDLDGKHKVACFNTM